MRRALYLFLLLGVVLIPFPFQLFPWQANIAPLLFGDLLSFILEKSGRDIFGQAVLSSDSQAMYLFVFLLAVLALFVSFLLSFWKNWRHYETSFWSGTKTILNYYLTLQLLTYGFQKLFKVQFYLPEPNTLYTPLGQLSRDLLFWSTMGTSYSYAVFMGLLEIIPALLLLFRRTRILGLLIAFAVLTNIVAINFSFDISVKIYSLFLWLLSVVLLAPYAKNIIRFLSGAKMVRLEQEVQKWPGTTFWRISLKAFVIGLIFLEALTPYLSTRNFNDDLAVRPKWHGAYEVQEVWSEEELLQREAIDVKRFFIHRRGYLIFQNAKDEMQDFKLTIDPSQQYFSLSDYAGQQRKLNFAYSAVDSTMQLQYFQAGQEYLLKAKALDWSQLPALQQSFHWTIEGVE